MFEHLHNTGEWMIGYRAMQQQFGGLRVASEYMLTVHENYNGYQLERQEGLSLNISRAF